MSVAKYYGYRNLHTGGFSIKHKGLVCETPFMFIMIGAEFRVSEAGRVRANKSGQRNVHAFVVAASYESYDLSDDLALGIGANVLNSKMFTEVTYNPFYLSSFVTKADKIPVTESEFIVAIQDKMYMRTSDVPLSL